MARRASNVSTAISTAHRSSINATFARRVRVIQAALLLCFGAVLKRTVPMRYWSSILGTSTEVPPGWEGTPLGGAYDDAIAAAEHQVALAVRSACARMPRKPLCLTQAIAAQVMLRRRGLPGVVVIGLKRPDGPGEWEAHAWLIGITRVVTGGQASSGFTATTLFVCPDEPRHLLAFSGTDTRTR